MIDVNLDFSGLQDIARDLQTLSKAENNKVLRESTRAGAELLREEVIDRAPEKSGKLKKNVVVVTQKSRRSGEISSGVHIRGVNPRTGKQRQYNEGQQQAECVLLALRGVGNIYSACTSVCSPSF
ncbi:Bacteriophage protein of uncharacterised function (DUF646) [Klebsiella pneumoniae]|nr:Bacteriophage protein of uncharacterised function (DUF646) [Klebsiella pneumoniae]